MTRFDKQSARRAGAKLQARVDYLAFYCAACGRVGYAARCSVCAEVVCVDRGRCQPRHQSQEYVAQRPINLRRAAR
jgi:hypothetical protein